MGNLLGAPVTEKETHVGTVEGYDIDFAVSSMQGWRVHMEDAHITEPRIYAMEPKNTEKENGGKEYYTKIELPGHSLYAVFDGHGGTFAANYAGKNMCRVLSMQPKFLEYAKFVKGRPEKEATMESSAQKVQFLRSGLDLLEGALRDTFVELDKEIAQAIRGSLHPDANKPYHTPPPPPTPPPSEDSDTNMEDAIHAAAHATAREHANALDDDGDSGTTACVVMVTPDWIICANAGDSRAVFSKHGNRAVPLSYDHKPDDEEEERRIRAAGGYVAGGRVEGDLAVSRGLGDFRFKSMATVCAGAHPAARSEDDGEENSERVTMAPGEQKVAPIPDIIVQNRNEEFDEFIVIACDGIWDVQSNNDCVKEIAAMFKEGEHNVGLVCEEVRTILL